MMEWRNVRIDDMPAHRAYLDPEERWNGWACPWFEFDEVMKMNEWLPTIQDERITYDAETDTFTVSDGYEITEEVSGKDIDGMHLYPIGNGIWIWLEEEQA